MVRRESQDIVGERSSRKVGSISSTKRRLKNLVSLRGIGPFASAVLGLNEPGKFGELLELDAPFREGEEPFLLGGCAGDNELSPVTLRPPL